MSAGLDAVAMHELLERIALVEPLSAEDRCGIAAVINGTDSIQVEEELMLEAQDSGSQAPVQKEKPAGDDQLYFRLSKMLLPEKIKHALLGNATCRSLLIRDSNRMIQAFVLKNPRLQPSEVEEFARNPHLSEYVIRTIADNQAWTKSYGMKLNLVFNPKTPLEISLKFLRYLNAYDVKRAAKSKNLPQTLTVMARKKVSETQQG